MRLNVVAVVLRRSAVQFNRDFLLKKIKMDVIKSRRWKKEELREFLETLVRQNEPPLALRRATLAIPSRQSVIRVINIIVDYCFPPSPQASYTHQTARHLQNGRPPRRRQAKLIDPLPLSKFQRDPELCTR